MNYQYQYPEAFWLLALVPLLALLFFFYLRWKKGTAKRIGDPHLVAALHPSQSRRKTVVKGVLLLLAFACGCIALSNPRLPDPASGEARNGIDIVVALDVSNSMLAGDIAPDRLTRAKQLIFKLMDGLQDDRLGLVVFAGNAYVQMPLTFDREAARLFVSATGPTMVATQGTNLPDALEKCALVFGSESERFRSVVLITDGETHDEGSAQKAAELAAKGIMINTVGIGSVEGATLADSTGGARKDAEGNVVISRLNESVLRELATATNGTYVHLQNTDAAVKTILGQFSGIDKKALGDLSTFTYRPLYAWLAVPMLLLLIAELFVPDRKKLRR